MISEAMKAEGWIEHDGGPCPIDAWQPVTIMRRDGKTARHPDSRFLDWRPYEAYAHTDIIAYKPDDPTPEALVIELEAQKIADAVCDNYAIRKHSLEWAMCEASALQALRTGQLAPVQQPSGDVVEAVARKLETLFVVQMDAQADDTLPSSIHREQGRVWLEGWFDLKDAARAALGEKP